MKYVITDGTNYLYIDRNKNQNITRNIKVAMGFDTNEKALNFIKNMKKTIQRFDWYIEQVGEKEDRVEPVAAKAAEELTYIRTKFEDNDFKWDKLIDTLEMIQKELPQYKENLSIRQSENEKEICDIYHYIEFMTLNASQLCKASVMLKERLKARRHIKDEIMRVHYMMDSTPESIKGGGLKSSFEAMKNRHYEPRVLKELFAV